MAEYLAFHYHEPSSLLPQGVTLPKRVGNFPEACARLLLGQTKGHPARALDLGCAVGRSTFELARRCSEVVGIDYSRSFIHSANQLKKSGRITFPLCQEGQRTTPSVAKVEAKIDRDKVHFQVGDALHLPRGLGTFDLILAANLIDRLPNPTFFASKVIPGLVKPNGLLLLTSPYTWSKEYTPPEQMVEGLLCHSPETSPAPLPPPASSRSAFSPARTPTQISVHFCRRHPVAKALTFLHPHFNQAKKPLTYTCYNCNTYRNG